MVFYAVENTMKKLLAAITLALPLVASAATYDFSGFGHFWSNGAVSSQAYTGRLTFNDTASTTVYMPGDFAPIQQGFVTTYENSITEFVIHLGDGTLLSGGSGTITVNNIDQAEPGAQVPVGLSMQIRVGGITGNGFQNTAIFSFLPVQSQFSPALFEATTGLTIDELQQLPSLLQTSINPLTTGTAIPTDLPATFTSGVTFSLNSSSAIQLDSISLAQPVPEPSAALLLPLGLLLLNLRKYSLRVSPT